MQLYWKLLEAQRLDGVLFSLFLFILSVRMSSCRLDWCKTMGVYRKLALVKDMMKLICLLEISPSLVSVARCSTTTSSGHFSPRASISEFLWILDHFNSEGFPKQAPFPPALAVAKETKKHIDFRHHQEH